MKKLALVLAAIGLLTLTSPSQAADVIIDPFTNPLGPGQVVLAVGAGGTASSTVGPFGSILGGFRKATVTNITEVTLSTFAAAVPANPPANPTPYAAFGTLGTGGGTALFTIDYDANGAGLGLNLSNLIAFFIQAKVDAAAGPGNGFIEVSDGVNTSIAPFIIPDVGNLSTDPFANITIPLGNFVGLFNFNTHTAQRISIIIGAAGGAAQDGHLDNFGYRIPDVPEPSTLALFGIFAGVGGVLAYRRRKAIF